MEWWRNIRDELIFRRYHKEIEQMCRGSGGSSTTNNKSTGSRKQQPERKTGIAAATTTKPQRKRKASSTSTNTGAELYFQKKRPMKKAKNTNGTTNGRISSKKFGTNQQQQNDDDDPIEHPSIQEYTESVQTYTQHEQDTILTIEEEYSTYFEEWRFISSTNHSLLFHGAGSKKPLLNKFADEELDKDGDVIKLDGFHKDITIDQILQLLIDHWLNGKEPSNIDLFHIHNLSNNNHDNQVLPFYPVRGDIYTIQKAVAIAKSISKIVSTTLRPIYIVIHNIDGVGLRNYTAQESLAALVSQSTTVGGLNAIRLVASIDHVNGPALLWDTITRHRFQWVWKEIQTQRPYLEEVIQSQTVGVEKTRSYNKRGGTKAITKMSTSEIGTNNADTLQQQRDSMFSVLKSLASRHTQALQQLAWLHLESKKEWITYVDLLNQCRLKCVVTQDVQLRNYLGELMDHHIVIRNDDKTTTTTTTTAMIRLRGVEKEGNKNHQHPQVRQNQHRTVSHIQTMY